MLGLAELLRNNKAHCIELMAKEMGKPREQGAAEIEKCALVCEHYATHAATYLADDIIATDATKSYIHYEPLGVVLAVMPWNYPFWQVFRCAAPILMAGNAIVLKHASNVSGVAFYIESLFKLGGFPDGLLLSVVVHSDKVGKLIENPLIKAVTVTGSVGAGKAIAAKAGAMLKKTVLELGGSDPYIILEDADLEKAVQICVDSRLINAGQSCVSAKRFIVVSSVIKRVKELFVSKMSECRMGPPLQVGIDMGPLARHDLRDQVHHQVEASVKLGAKVLLGGKITDGPGAFYPPTILTNVLPGMPAYNEEIFGPVASIIEVSEEKEAIKVANDSIFGLGAAVFTKDISRGERIASLELQAGCCFVNASVKSDPRLGFGGIKQSGYGRELSYLGIREFCNVKTVYIK